MVKGLPFFKPATHLCEHCLKGKHQRDPFPRQSNWRASQLLQLIHSDICGHSSPTSNGNKRYILTFIDDLSIKVWVCFLFEKSETFDAFKKFKALVEKQVGVPIQILRTDRGESTSPRSSLNFVMNRAFKDNSQHHIPHNRMVWRKGKIKLSSIWFRVFWEKKEFLKNFGHKL